MTGEIGEIGDDLRLAYNRKAQERDKKEISDWKKNERRVYLNLLQVQGSENLLEIGSGPGRDSHYFQQHGLHVTSTDLSPQMVRLCRQKGLKAAEMTLFNLAFANSHFDAVYTFNCLLHVPRPRLGSALLEIKRVMKPDALFFFGVHGGIESDGPWEEDEYRPQRHFTLYTDEQLLTAVTDLFIVRDFAAIPVPGEKQPEMHFQRLILQKPPD